MTAAGERKMPNLCHRLYPFHYTTALNLLAKLGVDINRIELLAVGEYENFKGEIMTQIPAPGTPLTASTRVVLEVGFSSAVDIMPYQFFYGLYGRVARGKDWELNARHLMAPFDAAVIRRNAVTRLEALRFAFNVVDEDHLDRFLSLFDFHIDRGARTVNEALAWGALLPVFHMWAGNPDRVAQVLGLLFGYTFRIVENAPAEFPIPDGIRYRLGMKSGRLGRETIIGRTFTESDSTYEVIVSGLPRDAMTAWLPGGTSRKKLDWVLRVCMPGNLGYRLRFEVGDRAAVLGGKKKGSYLGYSAHLEPARKRGTLRTGAR